MNNREERHRKKGESLVDAACRYILTSPIMHAIVIICLLLGGVLVYLSKPPKLKHEISTAPQVIPSDAKLPLLPSSFYEQRQVSKTNQSLAEMADTLVDKVAAEMPGESMNQVPEEDKKTKVVEIIEQVVLSPDREKKTVKPAVIPSTSPVDIRKESVAKVRQKAPEAAVAAIKKDEIAVQAKRTVAAVPGRYPEASTRFLTADDLKHLSRQEMQVMRNEIFARRSYTFKSADIQNYFSRQPWYVPRYNSVSGFNEFEVKNMKLIKKHEGL